MLDAVWVKAILKALVLPPGGPLLVALAGLALWRRAPRVGRTLAVIGTVALLLLSIPAVAWLLQLPLETAAPVTLEQARTAQAIVIPGGGTRRRAEEYGGDTLARLTLDRVRYGALLARQTGLPIFVTGGSVFGGLPEATLMRRALETEYGLPVRWVEAGSRTTHENAQRTAEALRTSGIHRIVLVMHGFDMRRAVAEFEAAGLSVVPAPTFLAGPGPEDVLDYLPSMGGLQGSYYALYELLGNAVRLASP